MSRMVSITFMLRHNRALVMPVAPLTSKDHGGSRLVTRRHRRIVRLACAYCVGMLGASASIQSIPPTIFWLICAVPIAVLPGALLYLARPLLSYKRAAAFAITGSLGLWSGVWTTSVWYKASTNALSPIGYFIGILEAFVYFMFHLSIGVAYVRRFRRHKRLGACRECGYTLTGVVSARCPECGHWLASSAESSKSG